MGPAVRRILIACALLAGLMAVAVLAFFVWKVKVDRDLDAAWRRSLGGATFLERYPKTEDNATVRELEALGAAIGIDMAPFETKGRARPTPEAAQRFAAVKAPLKNLLEPGLQPEDGALAAPPPALVEYLVFARPSLLRVIEVLLRSPPPVWHRDLGLGYEAPVANFLGSLQLQKVLLAEARERMRSGRSAEALEVLEASWRYNEALRTHNPSLIPQLMALAVLKLQQPVLRSLSEIPSPDSVRWRGRLDGVAARSWVLAGLRTEAFLAHQSSTLERPFGREEVPLQQSYWMRFLIWDHSRRFASIVEDLPRQDVRTFDPETFNREQQKRIPRWQLIARLLLPNFWDTWAKGGRAELNADLTARILEERERLATSGPPRTTDRRPSRVPGLSWIYEEVPEGTRIHLDGELAYRDPKPVPLRFLVRRRAGG